MINTGNNIITYSHATVKVDAFISVIEWPRIPALIPKNVKQIFPFFDGQSTSGIYRTRIL